MCSDVVMCSGDEAACSGTICQPIVLRATCGWGYILVARRRVAIYLLADGLESEVGVRVHLAAPVVNIVPVVTVAVTVVVAVAMAVALAVASSSGGNSNSSSEQL